MNKLRHSIQARWPSILAGSLLVGALSAVGLVMAHEEHKGGREDRDDTEIEIRMQAVNGPTSAEATIEWSVDSDDGDTELEIELEGVPEGDYTVVVGGEAKGVLQARQDDDGDEAEGELSFYSDGRDGALLLDFNPLGHTIEITSGDTVYFSATLPSHDALMGSAGAHKHKRHVRGDDDEHNDRYEERIERFVLYLENLGSYPDAKAKVSLTEDADGQEFEVDLEYLPQGQYALHVDGQFVGVIEVSAANDPDDGNEGEIEFSESPDEDDLLLNFQVRGVLIEVLQDDLVLFQGVL